MKASLLSLILFSSLVSFAVAQPVNGSRGSLPASFRLPEPGTPVHFSSPGSPDFSIPEFPTAHFRNGREGAAEVVMYVRGEGEVVSARISVSSGDPEFDEAALTSAMKSRFPVGYASVDGLPHDFSIAVPYYFLLSADPEQYWQSRLELARLTQEYEELMKEFQGYLMERTVASKSRKESIRRQIESKVAVAKQMHRLLAEKKESSILRLRDEITATREQLEQVREQTTANESDTHWRQPGNRPPQAAVNVAQAHARVVVASSLNSNELDRLTQELELKKSYM